MPPQAIDFEESVIGACLTETTAFDTANGILSAEMFYSEAHRKIFAAMQDLSRSRQPVNIFAVCEKLKQRGELEAAGGQYSVTRLSAQMASAAYLEFDAETVRDKYIRRELILCATENAALGYDDTLETDFLLSKANAGIEHIMELAAGDGSDETIENAVQQAREQLYKRIAAHENGEQAGISAGFLNLNRLTNGWQPEKVIILAARPAVGKTSLAIHFAKAAARQAKHTVFFSLEMGATELADKMIAAEADVNLEDYAAGTINEKQLQSVEQSLSSIMKLPVTVCDNPRVSVENIAAKARLLKKQGKCDIVIIDYLQLITPDRSAKNRTREQEVTEMSRLLKIHAKALKVPFIVLCQLNRDIEKRGKNAEPQLSDLRESGAIEQDADIVIFIDRPELYDDNAEQHTLELIVRKHRGGKLGRVKIRHNGSMNDFYDYAPQYSSNIPLANNYYEREERDNPF
jgi:replicative DNA helicase